MRSALHPSRLRSRLRRGRRAVTDVPLELLIIVVILAIVLPILVVSLENYSQYQAFSNLQQQANNVADTAIEVYDSGLNTTILLTVTVTGSYNPYLVVGANMLPSRIGGSLNYQAAWITYGLSSTGTGNQSVVVNDGEGPVLLTEVTCTNGAGVDLPYAQWTYAPLRLSTTPGTFPLSLTKVGPGSWYCGSRLPATYPTSFVEVEVTP